MASSKKSLTENQQIVEGFLDRIVNSVLNKTDKKAKNVLDALTSDDTALAKAQDELERANIKLRKIVKKKVKQLDKRDKNHANRLAKIAKLGG